MGWRYLQFVLGLITVVMVILRVFLFQLLESPKYLLVHGKYKEATETLHALAKKNNRTIEVTPESFEKRVFDNGPASVRDRTKIMFSKELRMSTLLLWVIWMLTMLGSYMFFAFLPKFLAESSPSKLSPDETYRNYLVVSIVSIPGSLLAKWGADSHLFGRRYSMALSTAGLSLSLFLFTILKSSTGQLFAACLAGFLRNIMYSK
jgi:predicted MFS family arabinose efflux permease